MNLLITGAWEQAHNYIPYIRSLGHDVIFLQQEDDKLPWSADWVEGIIGNRLFLYHPYEFFSHLRYVQLTSAGFDRVPLDQLQGLGVVVHNAKDVYSIPMAEHAVMGVLSLYRKLDFFRENQKRKEWKNNKNLRELYGKTVLIVGCGSTGTACAERFAAFGCEIHGIVHNHPASDIFTAIHPVNELDFWLSRADVLILSLPITKDTSKLLNRRRLSLLKDDVILVNLSRGGVIDQQALEDRIASIGGAVLDVFEEEPLPNSSPLWEAPNVLITPHNSFAGEGNAKRLSDLIIHNLSNYS